MGTLGRLWNGRVPVDQAFWFWGVGVSAVVNLFATLLGLALVARDAPAWLAAFAMLLPTPWNVLVLIGVWRSAGQSGMTTSTTLVMRLVMLAWVGLLCIL